MKYGKCGGDYESMHLKCGDSSPAIHLGSGKKLRGGEDRTKSRKRGISILKDKNKNSVGTVQQMVFPSINCQQYCCTKGRNEDKCMRLQSPIVHSGCKIMSKDKKLFYESPNRAHKNQFTEKVPIVKQPSNNFHYSDIEKGVIHRVTSQRVISIEKGHNVKVVNSRQAYNMPNEYIPTKRIVKFNSPEMQRPGSVSQHKFIVNFRKPEPVSKVKFTQDRTIPEAEKTQPNLNEQYKNESKQCSITEKSKETCEQELQNSTSKIPLELSAKSSFLNNESEQSLSLNLKINSKSIWDAFKTESIVSETTPSEAINQEKNISHLNQLKKSYAEMSGIQSLEGL